MNSRETILAAVKANQPERLDLPDITVFEASSPGSLQKFEAVLTGVGGQISYVSGYDEIAQVMYSRHNKQLRFISPISELKQLGYEEINDLAPIHDLQNVEVAVLKAHFGVAENGAVWITENEMVQRVLPFVTQHLAVVINEDAIVPTMHHAYELISSNPAYGFGTFIAGPSKTADIEQSLVIGAHGPRSMTVFVMKKNN